MSRQVERQQMRAQAWAGMSQNHLLADERGVIPRRIRRAMSLLLFHKRWKESRNEEQFAESLGDA